ncbi:helix-turn-helix domain-containing protein [Heliorestis convoluta]|uniref:XRE family transcriptional regulator n=1 Tax=Heliorestis convoluta TaxID=356322 RepID=A0A5Q2N069_9FIRM|nr:helix-turn-helix domain-containing protein [Heliorestis convoluta]QGG48337.1 XRE family transcriptional regulator [Heliorestis convoluta]
MAPLEVRHFGLQLLALRKEKKLTQEQLAQELNAKYGHSLGKSSISHYENGNRLPEIPVLVDLADFFQITLDQLLVLHPLRKEKDHQNKAHEKEGHENQSRESNIHNSQTHEKIKENDHSFHEEKSDYKHALEKMKEQEKILEVDLEKIVNQWILTIEDAPLLKINNHKLGTKDRALMISALKIGFELVKSRKEEQKEKG